MTNTRLLLPFTHGVDGRAMNYAIGVARHYGATLVPLALISVPSNKPSWKVRPEYIQQTKDFLEAIYYRADTAHVPVERHEIVTSNAVQSIKLFAEELLCDSIIVAVGNTEGAFLDIYEIKQLMEVSSLPLLLIELSSNKRNNSSFSLFSWLRKKEKQKRQEKIIQAYVYLPHQQASFSATGTNPISFRAP